MLFLRRAQNNAVVCSARKGTYSASGGGINRFPGRRRSFSTPHNIKLNAWIVIFVASVMIGSDCNE